MFVVEKINDDIAHVIFETQLEMNKTLLRFQEYYESPKFSGTIFTLGAFRKHYTEEEGCFNYYETVHGTNFEANVFEPFLKGYFDPLSPREADFLEKVGKGSYKYIIGSYRQCEMDIVEHEICHALFGTNESYKKKVVNLIRKYDTQDLKDFLRKNQYAEEVLLDEIHAYLICDRNYLKEQGVEISEELANKLLKLRRKVEPKTIY